MGAQGPSRTSLRDPACSVLSSSSLFSTMALPMKKTATTMKSAKSAMKATMKKVMKAKRVSVVAKGRNARSVVFKGSKEKTQSGMTKEKLMRNKNGRVVSKARSALSKKRYQSSKVKVWAGAVKQARKALGVTGFVAIGGKSAAGKALYAKAKSLL